jgi:ribonuclease BN (tRNA processing enzyme)
MIDAGATSLFALRTLGISTSTIGVIAFTHFHGDHMAGLPFLLLDMDVLNRRQSELIILGPPGIESACRRYYEAAYADHNLGFPLRFIETGDMPADLFGLSIAAHPVTHRPESVGYRVTLNDGRAIALSGDCRLDERLFDLMRGTVLAFLELSLKGRPEKQVAHVSLEELMEWRHRIETGRLILVHTTDELAAEAHRLHLGEAAHDGMEIRL